MFDLLLGFRDSKLGGYSVGFTLDTLGANPKNLDEDTLQPTSQNEPGETVDLFAQEKSIPGKMPRTTVTTFLRLLAREAKISLYAEIFLKEPRSLAYTRGKPEFLLSQICSIFGCEWRKIGGDYIVWSKSWAQERVADVSETLLDRWNTARKKQEHFELKDYLEMVRLSDLQHTTLVRILNVSGPFAPPNRDALRIVADLAPDQLNRAYDSEGVEIDIGNPQQLTRLQRIFGRQQIAPPVRLKLEQKSGGTIIQILDAVGPTYPRWAK